MARRVYRYEVPVDDRSHAFDLSGGLLLVMGGALHVEARMADGRHVVEFWAEHLDGAPTTRRAFRVFGTGQPLPDNALYVGTAARVGGTELVRGRVWHLFEVGT